MLQSIREKVASTSSKELKSQRKLAKTRPSPVYDVGDQVKISNRMKHKLDAKWRGPHTIVRRVSTTAYKVQLDTGERIHHLIHHAHLRPWYATDDDDAPDDPENDDDSNYDVEVEEPDDSNKDVRPEDPSVPKSEDPTPISCEDPTPISCEDPPTLQKEDLPPITDEDPPTLLRKDSPLKPREDPSIGQNGNPPHAPAKGSSDLPDEDTTVPPVLEEDPKSRELPKEAALPRTAALQRTAKPSLGTIEEEPEALEDGRKRKRRKQVQLRAKHTTRVGQTTLAPARYRN